MIAKTVFQNECCTCPIVRECEAVYRRYLLSVHPNPKHNDHDIRDFAEFALKNSAQSVCWNAQDPSRQKYMNQVMSRSPEGSGIAYMMKLTMENYFISPLPLVNEPFQIHRYASYDYYGNLIKKDDIGHPEWVVNQYESDVDRVLHFYISYFWNKIKTPMERTETRLPMTRLYNSEAIFNKLYGGFDFDALMRMISMIPSHHELEEAAFEIWATEEFRKFFNEFCEDAGINRDQIPEVSYNHTRDLFQYHMDEYVFNDYLELMEYPVGVELHNGTVYEMTGRKIFSSWATGHIVKELAASVVGLNLAMSEKFEGKKRGFFEKMFQKRILDQHRKSISWRIYPDGDKEESFNIRDVARFYPSPPGLPVSNPLL